MLETQDKLSHDFKEEAKRHGFSPVGIARIPGSNRIKMRTAALQRWLDAGYHGDMRWMEAPRRQSIQTLLKDVQSVLVVGLNYYIDAKNK